jgi:hypothetical protein
MLRRTRNIHAHFAFVAVSIIVISVCGAAVDGQTNTTATTTTQTAMQTACPAVTECLNDTLCYNCLRVLNSSIAADETAVYSFYHRSAQKTFFLDLIGPSQTAQ